MTAEAESQEEPMTYPALRGLVFNGMCLSLIALVGWATGIWISAAISVGVNFVVFLVHAWPQSSEKFFDATGTFTYLTLICSALVLSPSFEGFEFDLRQIVFAAMVALWAIRLGSYLLARICRDGKDARFDNLKVSWLLWLGVWSYQALWCFLVASPALIILSKPCGAASPSILDCVGWAVWALGWGFEIVADRQKDAFRRDPANKGRFINTGLWAYSRHPNYFGEITLWIGICISGMSCFRGWDLLAWSSPVTTFILLNFVSGVPLLEKVGDERWGNEPAYQHYKKHTPVLIPRVTTPPPFKASEGVATSEEAAMDAGVGA